MSLSAWGAVLGLTFAIGAVGTWIMWTQPLRYLLGASILSIAVAPFFLAAALLATPDGPWRAALVFESAMAPVFGAFFYCLLEGTEMQSFARAVAGTPSFVEPPGFRLPREEATTSRRSSRVDWRKARVPRGEVEHASGVRSRSLVLALAVALALLGSSVSLFMYPPMDPYGIRHLVALIGVLTVLMLLAQSRVALGGSLGGAGGAGLCQLVDPFRPTVIRCPDPASARWYYMQGRRLWLAFDSASSRGGVAVISFGDADSPAGVPLLTERQWRRVVWFGARGRGEASPS